MSTEAGTIKGYMVVRAPKGETSPYYFEKGNQEAIYAYLGLPTAHYTDLYEAEAFNAEYGCYISAPAGSSSNYPSYFGGSYLTKNGLVDFYNVTGKDVVDFTKKVIPGVESESYGWSKSTTTSVYVRPKDKIAYSSGFGENPANSGTIDTLAILISGILPTNWGSLQEIGLNYWGDDRTGHDSGTYYYHINKEDHKIYCEDEDSNPIMVDDEEKSLYCGIWGKDSVGNYFIVLGGGDWLLDSNKDAQVEISEVLNVEENTNASVLEKLGLLSQTSNNTYAHAEIPFFTMDGLITYVEEAAFLSAAEKGSSQDIVNWSNVKNFYEGQLEASAAAALLPQILSKQFVVNGLLYQTGDTSGNVKSSLTWLVNIKNETYGYWVQKSATEKTTVITISHIGYDKYIYDMAIPLLYCKTTDFGSLTKTLFDSNFANLITNQDNLFLLMERETDIKSYRGSAKLYQYDANIDSDTIKKCCTNVGENYITKEILITQSAAYTKNGDTDPKGNVVTANTLSTNTNKVMDNHILYVNSKSSFMLESETSSSYPLHKDINYNTMTFTVKEEVYPGELMGGGEFTGSFNETGKDSYGANIYWPNVLSPDDFSFIEFYPLKTFDDDVDSNGIYQGKRVVDDIMLVDTVGNPVGSSYTLNLKGQRYVTHVVEQNILMGTIGSSWRDEFEMIVKQGWNEAFNDEYDDVYVFMDPTGQEFIKSLHSSLASGTHQLAIYLSPKIITKSNFAKPSTITVTARNKLCAQYIGEFKCYDAYTGKYYWCQPIGDVGLMCCRIMENKMGGWPPAWYNYNNMGGQLKRAVLAAKWDLSDNATKILDEKGLNPIVYNADDGLMCVSAKTTQDPNNVTDWSFLAHVMAFNLCKRDIRDNVMRQQIEKPIDEYWMEVRQTQVDAILAKRTQGSNAIWQGAVCNIKDVNNDVTKAARKFVIHVKVKVTPFSESTQLIFENLNQMTVLS